LAEGKRRNYDALQKDGENPEKTDLRHAIKLPR
jgi:hypothetical protein